jgi:hypothetical protein
MRRLGQHTRSIHALALHGDTLYSAGDGEVRAWPLAGGAPRVLAALDDGPQALAVAPDGAWLAIGTAGGRVLVVGAAGGAPRDVTGESDGIGHGDGNGVVTVAIDARGERIAAGGGNDHVDVRTLDGTITFAGATDKWPHAVAFSPDGARLAIITWDAQLYAPSLDGWRGGRPWQHMLGWLPGPGFGLAWLGADEVVTCGVRDGGHGFVARHRVADGEVAVVREVPHAQHALALAGGRVIAGGNDRAVTGWTLPDLEPRGVFAFFTAPRLERPRLPQFRDYHDASGPDAVFALAAHADGRAFVGSADGAIVELSAAELDAGGVSFDRLSLERSMREVAAEKARVERVTAILERGREDPIGALDALTGEDPALAELLMAQLEAAVRAQLDDDGDA